MLNDKGRPTRPETAASGAGSSSASAGGTIGLTCIARVRGDLV